MKGVIPVKAAVPLNVSANGSVDLSLLQSFATGVQSSGRIILDVAARGHLAHPAKQGKVDNGHTRISTPDIPASIEGTNGQIQISGNRPETDPLYRAAGAGTF